MKRSRSVLLVVLLTACQQSEQGASPGQTLPQSEGLCTSQVTDISDVQGTGLKSAMVGKAVAVRGVVTLTGPEGLYLQQTGPIAEGKASLGIFVAAPELARSASKGDTVAVRGTVEELGDGEDTLTAIAGSITQQHCGRGAQAAEFDAHLPLDRDHREALEAMQLRFDQPLAVTEVRDVDEGSILISNRGLLRAPTEVANPGAAAAEHDRENRNAALPVRNDWLRGLDPYTRIHAGAELGPLSGVLGHDGRQLGLIAVGELEVEARPAPSVPPAPGGAIRVLGFNLYEYFNGDGRGSGFPGERGANTRREFERQAQRIAAAIKEIRPDVVAVMEMENDGFGPQSAMHAFRVSITEALGVPFEVAVPGSDRVGTDVISVGLIYRSDRLAVDGPAQILEGGSFGPLNRVPLAQVLVDKTSGERFIVVVNHLKSKGYCPKSGPDTDQGDGQACWNSTRVDGGRKMARWAKELGANAGTENLLLVGDFNAYRKEDPVAAILDEGFTELVERHNPDSPQYSYIYRGAAGTLDYAFGSEALASSSAGAFIWHINAAYPWSGRPSPPWLRASDHDPVIVDLLFSQPATSD